MDEEIKELLKIDTLIHEELFKIRKILEEAKT